MRRFNELLLSLFLVFGETYLVHGSPMRCPNRLFSFGDSLADTGNVAEVFPAPESLFSTNIVHRQTLKNQLLDRVGNGRLLIDFVAEALGLPLLHPYYRRIHPDFSHGVNFAFSGATSRNTSIAVPFYLYRQVNNYIYLKNITEPGKVIFWRARVSENVGNGFYWISIGINDFLQNYVINNFTVNRVKSEVVPDAVASVIQAIQRLYVFGARNFMVLNVPALGCLPQFLSIFGTGTSTDYDSLGCLIHHNDAVKAYGTLLKSRIDQLRLQLGGAHLMYGDYFQLHLDVVANPTSYGFDSAGTLTACCGGGGQFGVPVKPCNSTTPYCEDPDSFISWDGLHFTENFNRHVATKLLSTGLSSACKLAF